MITSGFIHYVVVPESFKYTATTPLVYLKYVVKIKEIHDCQTI